MALQTANQICQGRDLDIKVILLEIDKVHKIYIVSSS